MKRYANGTPMGRPRDKEVADKTKIRKEDKAYGLRFQGKRNEEGEEVGEGFLTREEARRFVDKAGLGPYKLDVGCGPYCLEGFTGIDISKEVDAPLQLDMEQGLLPFEDESIEEIYCSHFLEHINNLIPLMNEFHRVLTPRGALRVRVPVLPSMAAFQDPTHVRFFTPVTFNYWHTPDQLWETVGRTYGIKPFNQMKQQIVNDWELHVTLRK